MSLPVPNFDYDDNNSDVLDPRSIDQLTDPERYTKLTFDNMMDLTDIKKNNPPHVRVFRLISATNRIFKQRIVYQGENGKQVFTWDDEDLNIKDDAKGTGRTRAHIDKMTGRSGFIFVSRKCPVLLSMLLQRMWSRHPIMPLKQYHRLLRRKVCLGVCSVVARMYQQLPLNQRTRLPRRRVCWAYVQS